MVKSHMLQKRLLFIGALVVFFASVAFMWSVYAGCTRISCLTLPKGAVWKLTEVYEEVRGSVYRARYQMGEIIVRVDVRSDVDPDASVDYIHGRIAGMKALYDNIRSPYPGLLSNEIVCDEGFKPTYRSYTTEKNVEVSEIVGYLNDRLTFGSCQKDQATHRGAMMLFTCSSRRQLYQIEYIFSVDSYDQKMVESLMRTVGCR